MPRESNAAIRERYRASECFLLNPCGGWIRHGTNQRGTTMERSVKTLLMGTVALMAGVGLASAQGMRDVPSAGDRGASSGSSDQMKPGASGSQREMKGKQGKAEKSEKSEMRGQAQQGPSDKNMSKGQAKSERPEKSTTGQGASDKDELKSKSSAKPAEKSTTGQTAKDSAKHSAKDSAKDKADTGKSAADRKNEKSTTGQALKDKTEKSTTGQGSSDTKASSGSKAADTKASSDSKSQTQPMNRQSQDPNAAKQNQTTGSSTQTNSTTEQSNASIRSQAGVQVSSQQRTTIQQSVLSARNVPRVDRVSFSIHTGTVVPRNVRIVSVTTFPALIEVFPRYREYSFFVVEDEIVDVVPVGGGGHFARSSASTTVAVDLSEPEIREIQLVLIKRGYFHGRADGVWSPTVREALITFQRKEGFEATGR